MTKHFRILLLAVLAVAVSALSLDASAGSNSGVRKWVPDSQNTVAATSQVKPEKAVEAAFINWLNALTGKSPEALEALYTKDALVLPAHSSKLLATPEDRLDHFRKVVGKPNLKVTVKEAHIRVFGGVAVNTGFYTITYGKRGAMTTVPARFTFVYAKTNEGWKIVDHHCSKVPVMMKKSAVAKNAAPAEATPAAAH